MSQLPNILYCAADENNYIHSMASLEENLDYFILKNPTMKKITYILGEQIDDKPSNYKMVHKQLMKQMTERVLLDKAAILNLIDIVNYGIKWAQNVTLEKKLKTYTPAQEMKKKLKAVGDLLKDEVERVKPKR